MALKRARNPATQIVMSGESQSTRAISGYLGEPCNGHHWEPCPRSSLYLRATQGTKPNGAWWFLNLNRRGQQVEGGSEEREGVLPRGTASAVRLGVFRVTMCSQVELEHNTAIVTCARPLKLECVEHCFAVLLPKSWELFLQGWNT